MAEMILGGFRHDDVYRKAYWAKHSLDRSKRHFDIEDAAMDCTEFFLERKKNRTLGDIAYAAIVKKFPIKPNSAYSQNLAELKKIPSVNCFLQEIIDFNKKNYPKTGILRKKLILNDRFRLNEVLPKLTNFQKFKMKLKTIFM